LEAFLPQMKRANEELAQQQATTEEQGTAVEEGVELEFISSSSEDSSSSGSSSSDHSDEDSDDGDTEDLVGTGMQEDTAIRAEQDTMTHLLNINSRPKIGLKKDLVAMEQDPVTTPTSS
jgi:hypothetical protein